MRWPRWFRSGKTHGFGFHISKSAIRQPKLIQDYEAERVWPSNDIDLAHCLNGAVACERLTVVGLTRGDLVIGARNKG